jgi:hypothetical protein
VTRRTLKRYRGGGLDPFEHNRIAARRKKYRSLAKSLRAAGRSTNKAAASFRMLAVAADRAAESLRALRSSSSDTSRKGQQ